MESSFPCIPFDCDLLVTKRRSSWACIGNPKPEQETIEGAHVHVPVDCNITMHSRTKHGVRHALQDLQNAETLICDSPKNVVA